ncbi:neither inactivation nor afterpotential protein G-like [Diaphorina citri]|uniref:Neither inactivation nor afterpotential protein G-like n=1 Tax=Diaphorina citri TaxID=121845 RepID=A0A1S3DNI9_DIACI|nr:neither inactivation nor afterpotential protein G-like [Diaphorina citri]
MQCAVQALKMSMEMLQTKPFHTLRVSPHLPRLSGCDHLEASIMNEDYLSCIIRQAEFTSYHPGGTCALGEGGVVDDELRVHGVQGLRVVDGSVFPSPVAGNSQHSDQ